MAKVTVYKNGNPIEIDDKDLKVPKEKPKVKGNLTFGRKDRLLLKWLANRFAIPYNQLLQELNILDTLEPDDNRPF